jgi:hypothetical protein
MTTTPENSQKNLLRLYINEIAHALVNRRAAIMVGSGFSKNASKDFPSWQELGNQIFQRLHGREPEKTK